MVYIILIILAICAWELLRISVMSFLEDWHDRQHKE